MEEGGASKRSPVGEALRRWMEEKGISRCPACGSEGWWAFGRAKTIAAPHDPVEREPWPVMDSDLIAQVPCGNCAYLMSFRAESVWTSEPAPPQEA
jgi:hypothetical protein